MTEKTIAELKQIAKEKGIKNISKLKKSELIETIMRASEKLSAKKSEEQTEDEQFEKAEKVEKTEKKQKKETHENNDISGVIQVLEDGFGFIRCENFLTGTDDCYVSPTFIRKFNLKTGDMVCGNTRPPRDGERFPALIYIKTINGDAPGVAIHRTDFDDLTPIFPDERIRLEAQGASYSMRLIDLVSPIGKGQRGMIVSPPKAGKTTLLKEIANSITKNYPDIHLIVLLIDERPEEVTDIKDNIKGEIIYSTFDQLPEHHIQVAEMVLERAKRLVEHKKDVVILLDSLTRLSRAYNLVIPSSGKTLSGGIDPGALHKPKKFFGAARNLREGGSLTILATALVETGSRMDDVIFEEFKGTGNMEVHLDRKMSERRIFPAIDINKSGTRREDLLMSTDELKAVYSIRRAFNECPPYEVTEKLISNIVRTKNNKEFVELIQKAL